jgi:hypothetical protein
MQSAKEGIGYYLFCFTRKHGGEIEGEGLTEGDRLSAWHWGQLAAIVSEVDLHNWTGTEAERCLQDINWLGPRVCRHEAVIGRMMSLSPVFPARFGTIFSSLTQLEEWVSARSELIEGFLDYIQDKREWAVKGLIDRELAKKAISETHTASLDTSQKSGMNYLQRKQWMSQIDRELNGWLNLTADNIAESLAAKSSDMRTLRLLSPQLSGREREMVWNWAFLVPDPQFDEFHQILENCNRELLTRGLELELTGPWAAYNFCPEQINKTQ